jgi:hypothetical protein
MVELKCKTCNSSFEVENWRKDRAKYCSAKCANIGSIAKNNISCSNCGKDFHIKKSQLERYNRNHGVYCSIKCYSMAKKVLMSGSLNHQYGLKGDLNSSFKGCEITRKNNNLTEIKVYCPENPNCDVNGRVSKHRLLVEENYKMFQDKCFEIKNGIVVLKKIYHMTRLIKFVPFFLIYFGPCHIRIKNC